MSDWKNVQYKDGKMRTNEGGGGSSTFAGLDDVNFSDIQNGQVPKYNSTTQKWENADESGGGGTVTDVQVDGTSVVNPQTGVAEIEMPTPPTIPVEDVEVNGTSVVNAQNVAEITSYKEVTLAEYQALPSSKTSDGVLYCIKDAPSGVEGFPPLIYSDEEREIGVWRDGKPLYQKTISISALPSSVGYADYTFNMNNFDIKHSFGDVYWSNGDTRPLDSLALSSTGEVSTTGGISYTLRQSENKIRIFVSADRSALSATITIQYTKTTDTAGSGTWTMQGGYAHHYSTTEQVIGTWIDGKPLYEKTVTFTVTTRGVNNYAHGISNVKFMTSVNGVVLRASDNTAMPINMARTSSDSDTSMLIGSQAGSTNVSIFARNNDAVGGTAYVTIQYTKTTD